jgi:hypothetical protein
VLRNDSYNFGVKKKQNQVAFSLNSLPKSLHPKLYLKSFII